MTSRERINATLNHQKTDRIPIDLWATPEVQKRLMDYLSISNWEGVLKTIGIDMRWLMPDYVGPKLRYFNNGVSEDHFGIRRKSKDYGIGTYDEIIYHPLGEAQSISDIENYTWPNPDWWDYDGIKKKIEDVDTRGEVWIGVGASSIFERAWEMRGLERFLEDLVLNEEIACCIMDKLNTFYMEQTNRILDAGRGRIDMVYTADDVGTQSGMMLSYEMWKRLVYPRQKMFNQMLKKFHIKIFYHSCGSIVPVINDLIELGVDILNPIQPKAQDMEPHMLKDKYGYRLTFHGGIDVQHTLPHGSPGDVRREVEERIRILGKGGGYILSPSHNIQPDTPIDNILAMYEAVQKISF